MWIRDGEMSKSCLLNRDSVTYPSKLAASGKKPELFLLETRDYEYLIALWQNVYNSPLKRVMVLFFQIQYISGKHHQEISYLKLLDGYRL